MEKELDRITRGILGDIEPLPSAREHLDGDADLNEEEGADQSMTGGSGQDRAKKHAGSRDVTEGGAGTEVGGTRNYRQGTGAAGGDIGNRPE